MTAPAAMPSEEEIQFVLAQPLKHDDWIVEKARAVLALFAPVVAEKERRIRELALLLDKQMGTPCEQIRHQQETDSLLSQIGDLQRTIQNDGATIGKLEAALTELRKQMLADEGQEAGPLRYALDNET